MIHFHLPKINSFKNIDSHEDSIEIDDISWNDNDVLGKGGFGKVFLGNLDGQRIAVKCVQLKYVDHKLIDRKLVSMQLLDHPNVMKLLFTNHDHQYK